MSAQHGLILLNLYHIVENGQGQGRLRGERLGAGHIGGQRMVVAIQLSGQPGEALYAGLKIGLSRVCPRRLRVNRQKAVVLRLAGVRHEIVIAPGLMQDQRPDQTRVNPVTASDAEQLRLDLHGFAVHADKRRRQLGLCPHRLNQQQCAETQHPPDQQTALLHCSPPPLLHSLRPLEKPSQRRIPIIPGSSANLKPNGVFSQPLTAGRHLHGFALPLRNPAVLPMLGQTRHTEEGQWTEVKDRDRPGLCFWSGCSFRSWSSSC